MKKLRGFILKGYILLLAFTLSYKSHAQILREGTPPSTVYSFRPIDKVLDFTPDFDWNKILDEDDQAQKQGTPMRAGFALPVGLDINNSGEWTLLPDGRMMWRISISAKGATALGIVFDNYELSEGSELYLYNMGKSMINGALGSHNNNDAGVLSTKVLYGDIITVEYIESAKIKLKKIEDDDDLQLIGVPDPITYKTAARLHIGEIMYMYTDVYAIFDGSKPNDGGSAVCQIDINCAAGDSWQNQKRGVAHTLNKIGTSWYYCSGTLINNTLENFTPYFYTAWHCGDGASAADRNQWQFYFNYERSGCGSGTYYKSDMMTGCELKATVPITGGSDMLLVELKDEVPSSYNPFFNGWDRQNIAATSGASIHHPAGDAKKISSFSATLQSATPTISGQTMATNGAWRVVWSSNESGWGVTEGGSSGSPLFNQNGLVIGALSGGSSSCASPSSADFYGKLYHHWDQNGSGSPTQLKYWLDPLGTNPTTLRGWDPHWNTEPPIADFSTSTPISIAGSTIKFNDLSTNGPNQWFWDFGDHAFPQTSTLRNPEVIWINSGSYTVTLTVSNDYGSNSKTLTDYITITSAPEPPTTNPVIIGAGTNTSLYPFGIDGRVSANANHVKSVSLYTAAEIGGGGLISTLEWYANTARADERNIQIWMKHTTATILSSGTFANYTSGVTQVYSGTFTPNPAGWVPINLTSNFIYNGSDNLLVIVYVNSTSTANITSACRYSTATSRHHRWNARNAEPTGNGTVDNNRPNIRFSFADNTPPVANFGSSSQLFFENFEGESFPPEGWTIYNIDGGGNTWNESTQQNHSNGGTKSAVHLFHSTQNENGYLVTPQIFLPEDNIVKLIFWSYNGWPGYYGSNSVRLSTSDNSVASFTELLWEPSSVTEGWVQTTVDLTPYAGQSVYLAFRYQGTDAHNWWLDDVAISKIIDDPVTVWEGDEFTIYDISTHNPFLWDWDTPGSVQQKHTSQDVTLKYNVEGTYDVSLRAGNIGGTSLKSVTSFVTVVGRPPIADFIASGNFRNISFQEFVPMGGSVKFTDLSERVPTAWNWTFIGGNPSTNAEQNPTAVYHSSGEFDVSLNAVNNHGSDSKTEFGLVKVGGTDYITNQFAADEIVGYNLTNGQLPGHGQFTSGTSTYRFYEWAEYYSNDYEIEISSVVIGIRSAIGTGKTITIKIWDGSEGIPTTILASKTMNIPDFVAEDYNEIVFDTPVSIYGDFFIGFQLNYETTHDYSTHLFSIYTAADRGEVKENYSSAYFKVGTTVANAIWYQLNEVYTIETSMSLHPQITYPSSGVVIGDVNPDGFVNVLDVVWFVDHLNDNTPAEFDMDAADVNGNGTPGEIGDFTALIELILNGAKEVSGDIKSDVANIYLNEEGMVTFSSDGTLTALQFELSAWDTEMEIDLLLDTDHKLVFNKLTGKGVIYSMSNTSFTNSEIEIMKIKGLDMDLVKWGKVLASNINHQAVEVVASKYCTTSIPLINEDFKLTVFPNPSTGDFIISILLPYDAQLEFQLIDLVGRLISQSSKKFKTQGEHQIDFRAAQLINPGVYIIRVNAYNKLGKILVQKYDGKVLIVK